jgi:DNA-directed RNA polymerase subunit RPC12/RpoP
MAGVWTYLILIILIFALGAALRARRRRLAVNPKPDRCSNCKTPMSLRRVSALESHAVFGEWACPHCGTRMDRKGKVPEAA